MRHISSAASSTAGPAGPEGGGHGDQRQLSGGRARRGRAGQSWLARLALASCAVLLAACGSSGGSSNSTGVQGSHTPVKVGYLLPLTGVFTKNGISEQDGFKLGLQHFGTSVDGHPIQVTYDNDQGEPAVSLSDARQLVTADHVQAIEGPLLSSAIAAVAPYVLGQGIPEDDLYLASPQQAAAYTRYGTGFTSGWDGFATDHRGRPLGLRHHALAACDHGRARHLVRLAGRGRVRRAVHQAGRQDRQGDLGAEQQRWTCRRYVSAIPASTQAVFVVLSGSQAANFVNDYRRSG